MIDCEPNSPFINLGTMPKSVPKKNHIECKHQTCFNVAAVVIITDVVTAMVIFFALHHHLVCCYFIKSIHYSIQIVMTMMMCNKMNEICLQTTIKVEDVNFMAGVSFMRFKKQHILFLMPP